MTFDAVAFDRVVQERIDAWTAELVEFLRFPSEQDQPEALEAAAQWTAERLARLGAAVEVVRLEWDEGEEDARYIPPLVVGEIGEGPRTLNLVQHYDVQPAVPFELWTTPPYEPDVRDGRVWARGATDNKGEFLPRLWAVEAMLAAGIALPCRIRFLVEGQEEAGSRNLDELLDLRPMYREADGALIEGGGLTLEGEPDIVGGGRGMIVVELIARTIAHDAHSSLNVILPNAGIRLVQALATLWDQDGRPAVDGLKVGVRAPSPSQLALLEDYPTGEKLDEYRAEFGVDRFLGGLDGLEALEALTFQPTCNLQGIWSGYTGPGVKTVTPAEAHARIDIRLVPDQDPDEVFEALRAHLAERGFADIQLIRHEAERAWWTDPAHPIVRTAVAVSEEATGKKALLSVSMPGTVPMWQVCSEHRVPATTLGAGRDDCKAHAPDENIRIEDLVMATRIAGRFYRAFADLPEVPKA